MSTAKKGGPKAKKGGPKAKKGGPKAKKGGSKVKQNGSKAIYNLQTEKLCEVDRTSTHHDATAQGKGHRHFDWKSLPADKEYNLSRYLEIDCENEPLRYEAAIAIAEQRVHQGQNMLGKKAAEEGWCLPENSSSSSLDPERGSILDENPLA